MLTRAGLDLVRICHDSPPEDHFMSVLERWLKANYVLWTPITARPNTARQ